MCKALHLIYKKEDVTYSILEMPNEVLNIEDITLNDPFDINS